MLTNLDSLSRVVDNATLSRRLANAVKSDKERISREIDKTGKSHVSVAGRTYEIVKPSPEPKQQK